MSDKVLIILVAVFALLPIIPLIGIVISQRRTVKVLEEILKERSKG